MRRADLFNGKVWHGSRTQPAWIRACLTEIGEPHHAAREHQILRSREPEQIKSTLSMFAKSSNEIASPCETAKEAKHFRLATSAIPVQRAVTLSRGLFYVATLPVIAIMSIVC
eukprot:6206211-Pleurochrysis_carterae.AAC.3